MAEKAVLSLEKSCAYGSFNGVYLLELDYTFTTRNGVDITHSVASRLYLREEGHLSPLVSFSPPPPSFVHTSNLPPRQNFCIQPCMVN